MSRLPTKHVVHKDTQTFVDSIDFFNVRPIVQKWGLQYLCEFKKST